MGVQVGDLLLVANDRDRMGLVIAVPKADGSPPYIVRWLRGGHIAMVYPDNYSRIVPARHLTAGEPPERDR